MRKVVLASMLAAALAVGVPALAQEQPAGVRVTTPYPGISVEPGSTASFDLVVTAPEGVPVDLTVAGVPDGWTGTIRGGGSVVNRVIVGPEGSPELRLDVTVPVDAADGDHELTVTASSSRGSAELPLMVTVQAGAGGSVTLTPDFPGLQGPSDATFTFDVEVANDTPADVQLELAAQGPEGWRVEARPAGQTQASTITVESGQTASVDLTAEPPLDAEAGIYDVTMTVTGAGVSEELTVQVQLIGELSLLITTPDQRLNAEVTGGQPSEFPIVVINDGSAPLTGIELSATPPTDWEVTFTPEAISQLAPGETATVTATISSSADAIAGDYSIDFRASADTANDSMEVRTTVNPSPFWGIVGIGLIALTLAGLAAVFRRYGRR